MKLYFDFLDNKPTQVIDEASQEECDRVPMKDRKIRRQLLDFSKYLTDEGKAPNYIQNCMVVVRSFYSEFELQVPKMRLNLNNQSENVSLDKVLTKEHLNKVLNKSNAKYKAIILLMFSSGMGSAEIRHLQYKDFLNAISDYVKPSIYERFDIPQIRHKLNETPTNDIVGTWKIVRLKTGKPYFTFSSPESINAILDYLMERQIRNRPVEECDDWLFEAHGRQISKPTLISFFKRMNDHFNFGRQGLQRFFKAHALRKMFSSVLYKNKFPQLTIDWLLGHSIDKTTAAYFKEDSPTLKKEYMTVLPELSIGEVKIYRIDEEELKKIKEQEKRIQELENQLEQFIEYQIINGVRQQR